MTNMSQAPATEKKGVSDLLGFKIFGMPLPLYALYSGKLASACQYSTNISVALR